MKKHSTRHPVYGSNKQYGLWAVEEVASPPGTRGSERPGVDAVKPWGRADTAMGEDTVTFYGRRG